MNPRVRIVVSFDRPKGVTREQAKEYVKDAVRSWSGGLLPEDDERYTMADLDIDTVSVKLVRS